MKTVLTRMTRLDWKPAWGNSGCRPGIVEYALDPDGQSLYFLSRFRFRYGLYQLVSPELVVLFTKEYKCLTKDEKTLLAFMSHGQHPAVISWGDMPRRDLDQGQQLTGAKERVEKLRLQCKKLQGNIDFMPFPYNIADWRVTGPHSYQVSFQGITLFVVGVATEIVPLQYTLLPWDEAIPKNVPRLTWKEVIVRVDSFLQQHQPVAYMAERLRRLGMKDVKQHKRG